MRRCLRRRAETCGALLQSSCGSRAGRVSCHPMATYRIVVVAASAGGLTALTAVLGRLPATFGLPIAIVQHIDPHHVSRLAEILGRRAQVRVKQADDGDVLAPGVAYIAPPGQHLVVAGGGMLTLTNTAPVHFSRPSADRLFESAA